MIFPGLSGNRCFTYNIIRNPPNGTNDTPPLIDAEPTLDREPLRYLVYHSGTVAMKLCNCSHFLSCLRHCDASAIQVPLGIEAVLPGSGKKCYCKHWFRILQKQHGRRLQSGFSCVWGYSLTTDYFCFLFRSCRAES
jgi:hypothetical protein